MDVGKGLEHELTRVGKLTTSVNSTQGQLNTKKVNCNIKREKRYFNYSLRIYGHAIQLKHDEL